MQLVSVGMLETREEYDGRGMMTGNVRNQCAHIGHLESI